MTDLDPRFPVVTAYLESLNGAAPDVTELLRLIDEKGWYPMEEAPRDGKSILVLSSHRQDGRHNHVFWNGEKSWWELVPPYLCAKPQKAVRFATHDFAGWRPVKQPEGEDA